MSPKFLFLSGGLLLLSVCRTNTENQLLQARLDILQGLVNNAYKPGVGEFMSETRP